MSRTPGFASSSRDMNNTSLRGWHKVSTSLPLMITTPRSERHELVLVPTQINFWSLGHLVCEVVAASVNCTSTPAASTHQSDPPQTSPGPIQAMRVRWAKGSEAPGWPEMTVATPKNFEAVLEMLARRSDEGKCDVLECEFWNWGPTSGGGSNATQGGGV